MTTQSTTRAPRSLDWIGDLDGHLRMLDQTLLPEDIVWLDIRDPETVWEAIKMLRVRGAPAIGIAAAFGLVLGVRDIAKDGDAAAFRRQLHEVSDYLAGSRPTAVNLFWALDRMKRRAEVLLTETSDLARVAAGLLVEAKLIREEDAAMCKAIGKHGLSLIRPGAGVMTHCNAGALATAEWGTALAPMYLAHDAGTDFKVYARETRPLLQGSRLTAWELSQAGIDVTLICDSTAGMMMRQGKVDVVITGADRIAANGDAANKIGTYELAVLAKAHNVPFYVAAPSSTFDLSINSGEEIPIEERDADEIRAGFGKRTAPADIACYTPAFDVTPAHLIAGLITERGLIQPVNEEQIRRQLTEG